MGIAREIVIDRILHALFPDPKERAAAARELSRYGSERHHYEVERVRLAILRLTSQYPSKLAFYCMLACQDYQNLLVMAEYPLTSVEHPSLASNDSERYRALREREALEYQQWMERMLERSKARMDWERRFQTPSSAPHRSSRNAQNKRSNGHINEPSEPTDE